MNNQLDINYEHVKEIIYTIAQLKALFEYNDETKKHELNSALNHSIALIVNNFRNAVENDSTIYKCDISKEVEEAIESRITLLEEQVKTYIKF